MSLPLGQAQVVRWGGTVPLAWPVLRLTSSHVVYSGKDCVREPRVSSVGDGGVVRLVLR